MALDQEIQEANKAVAQMVSRFSQEASLAEPGVPLPTVKAILNEHILSHTDDGRALSTAMQLPGGWNPIALSYLTGDELWRGILMLEVRIKNIGKVPINITTEVDRIYEYDNDTGELLPHQYTNAPITQKIKPGSTVDLACERAVQALFQYCRRAWHPSYWKKWPHDVDALIDVGWRCKINNKWYQSDGWDDNSKDKTTRGR